MIYNWEMFVKTIKRARKDSTDLYGFSTLRTVRIGANNQYFNLNPYRVNLRTGEYGTEFNLMNGKVEFVPNLKKLLNLEVKK